MVINIRNNHYLRRAIILLFSLLACSSVWADYYSDCLLAAIKDGAVDSAKQIRTECQQQADNIVEVGGPVTARIKKEKQNEWSRFNITPHKRNYFLPFSYSDKMKYDVADFKVDAGNDHRQYESKFQVSLKVPLNHTDIFRKGDKLYLGFTIRSWWQFYSSKVSKPFRETNYQPEIFYMTSINWQPFGPTIGGRTGLILGLEHESNGRSLGLSRSWNRVYLTTLYEVKNLVIQFRPWYRLPEDKKDKPNEASGDDNPDIAKFMGYFDLRGFYRKNGYEYSILFRNNMQTDNKGAVELGVSFPFYSQLRGFIQYFNGYGESMIDYDVSQQRLSFGLLLTDII